MTTNTIHMTYGMEKTFRVSMLEDKRRRELRMRTWKNKDVRMTGCVKIFTQPVVVTGKNCSESTMKNTPEMMRSCSPKNSPAVTSDEKLFWAPKQGNHSLFWRAVETVMHCGKCVCIGNSPTTMVRTDDYSAYKRTRKVTNRLLEMVELLMPKRQFWWLSASLTKILVARRW